MKHPLETDIEAIKARLDRLEHRHDLVPTQTEINSIKARLTHLEEKATARCARNKSE
jgi:tetrahydromethanopterin S-methyltransferase subunit G